MTAGCAAQVSHALTVRTENGDSTQTQTLSGLQESPIHRILRGSDGKTIFAYDLRVGQAGTDGIHRLVLMPSESGPTFSATRTVNLKPGADAVRVELLAKPGTSQKVVDVFTFAEVADRTPGIIDHLMEAHNRFFRWVHGQ
jgi:hypothetical protein